MSFESAVALAVFILVNFAVSVSGAVFRPGEWYENLRKPGWTPPDIAFPIVWTILFLCNAVSGWLVWEAAGLSAAPALSVYAASLLLNAAWSALFFGLKRMQAALWEVCALWSSIALVAALFRAHSPAAAALQLPYLVWVTVAAALNFRLLGLNPRES